MIYSVVPSDVIFFDDRQLRNRHIRLYDNVTFEMLDGRVERIISTNPRDYIKYCAYLGRSADALSGADGGDGE